MEGIILTDRLDHPFVCSICHERLDGIIPVCYWCGATLLEQTEIEGAERVVQPSKEIKLKRRTPEEVLDLYVKEKIKSNSMKLKLSIIEDLCSNIEVHDGEGLDERSVQRIQGQASLKKAILDVLAGRHGSVQV